jgi:hypothetical protein
MSAAVSNVIPLRWTSRGFVRAGVVFVVAGGTVTVQGPPGRDDLREALLVELQRRVDVFVKFAPLEPSTPFPRVAMPGVPTVRSCACDACGDALDVGRGGMCALCTLALQRVLKMKGRL